jgi:hypothetical protein
MSNQCIGILKTGNCSQHTQWFNLKLDWLRLRCIIQIKTSDNSNFFIVQMLQCSSNKKTHKGEYVCTSGLLYSYLVAENSPQACKKIYYSIYRNVLLQGSYCVTQIRLHRYSMWMKCVMNIVQGGSWKIRQKKISGKSTKFGTLIRNMNRLVFW